MSQLSNVVITDIEVIQKTEDEWKKDNPVVGLGYGAYSTDTHLMRRGDGTSKWNQLEAYYPSSYVGAHAHTHEVGGNDEINIDYSQLPHTTEGTVIFGTGVESTNKPVSGFTLMEGYVCENQDEVNKIKNENTDQKIIFDTWERFSHLNATSGSNVTGDENNAIPNELTKWNYDTNTNTINCTINSSSFIGFVSPKKYTDYTFKVTLKSLDGDDDTIGIILAYIRDSNGIPHTLSLLRKYGDVGPVLYGVVYDYNKSTYKLIKDGSLLVKWPNGNYGSNYNESGYKRNPGNAWSSATNGITVEAVRNGDIITTKTSELNETSLLDSSLLTIDLNSDPVLNIFKQPSSIGYCCNSQNKSSWSNITFTEPSTKIYNLENNTVEEVIDGTWAIAPNETVYTEFKPGRFVRNKITEKCFYIHDGYTSKISEFIDNDKLFVEFISKMKVKTTITSDLDFYVTISGNDTTGDGSSSKPWRTIQHAVDVSVTNYSIGHNKITIHVGAGQYNEYIQLPEIETQGIAGTMAGVNEGVAIIEGAGDSTILNIGPAFTSADATSSIPQYIGMCNAGNWLVKNMKVISNAPDQCTALMGFVSSYGKLFLQDIHCEINNRSNPTRQGTITFAHSDVSGCLFILSGCTFTYRNNGVPSDNVCIVFGADLSQLYIYGELNVNCVASTPTRCATLHLTRGAYCIQNYSITGTCNGYSRNASTGGVLTYSNATTCVGSLGESAISGGIVSVNTEFKS